MQSRNVETEVRNCVVSSDADCDVAKDFSTSFVSKVASGDVCTGASSKTLARIPEFNFHYLFPKHSRKRRLNSRKCRSSNECCHFDEEKGQNSASPFQRSGVCLIDVKKEPSVFIDVKTEPSVFIDVKTEPSVFIDVKNEPSVFIDVKNESSVFIDVKKEPSVTSNMSSDASNVIPMTLEQVIPDFAFIMKTICENHIVIQSIMMLLLNCHPELAFDKVTLELAAFREFMLLKLNQDKTDEIAAEAISLYRQRQNQLLAQKDTALYSRNHENNMCQTVQCHTQPILSDQHFVPNHPSCWSFAPEPMNHKTALPDLQLSEGSGNQLSKSCVPHINLCQLPVTSSMRNSVTDDVSTACAISCMIKKCVDIPKGQNKNCDYQCGNLMPLTSLECGEKVCSLVQSSVNTDLCQQGCKTSVKMFECDYRKIDSVCNSFQSFLSLPVKCGNYASTQMSAVTDISCMPSVYSQREKPVAADCRSVISKSPELVTQFLTSKPSQNDDIKANATSTFGFNYQMNEHELSGTAAVETMLAYSSDSMPNLQSFSNLCIQEFPQIEPKTNEDLNLQEIIHPSMASVATKTESRLQSCVSVIQPNEVTAIDAVKANLNNFESIPSKKIFSRSNVRLSCQNNIEQLGIPSFDDQKNTADRSNPKDVEICATTRFGDWSRIRNVPRLNFERELLGDEGATVTDAKPVLNPTNINDTLANISANAGQWKFLNENSRLHSYSSQCNNKGNGKQFSNVYKMKSYNQKQSPMYKGGAWKKKSLQQNFSRRFCYSPPYRSSGCVKLPADYKEVGRLAEHSTTLAANDGYWSLSSGHPNFNRLPLQEKSDACRADFRRLVKQEIVSNDHQESRNAGIACGRLYILHISCAVSSEQSMCNCNKEPDWDVFSGFSGFNLRPELREVISELDFEVPTKVQRCCLRPLLDGLDMICAEGSGAGKTTLLALSTLQHLQSSGNQVAILVLCHTYRAMVAVYDCFRKFSAYMNNVRAHILSEGFESHQHLQRHEPQILIGSVQSVLQLTYVRPDLFRQLKHFILEDCDVMLRQPDVCKNIERIAEFVPQEKQVILVCRKMFPLIGNMFKKLVPYEVKMTSSHNF